MIDSVATLEMAQKAYNSYMNEIVRPSLGILQADEDRLTDAEIAHRISDLAIRREFVRRAIALLEANVRHYNRIATPIAPERNASIAVIASLLAAAVGYYLAGPVAALIVAAAAYWLGHRHSMSAFSESLCQAESHNAAAPDWKQSIDGWELSIRELRDVET
jgi:divalent metal cation (Fe/Co/Zn/Cd) transporter